MARITERQMRQRCWDNGIRMYPVPLQRGFKSDVILHCEVRNDKKIGKVVYKQDKKGQEEIAKEIDRCYLELYFAYKHTFKDKNYEWCFTDKKYKKKLYWTIEITTLE